jgi:hypothetical protein
VLLVSSRLPHKMARQAFVMSCRLIDFNSLYRLSALPIPEHAFNAVLMTALSVSLYLTNTRLNNYKGDT